MRLKWNIDEDTLAWAAVSRGLTIPDRGSEDGMANVSAIAGAPPLLAAFVGTETSKTEEVIAYELGYRAFIGHKNLLDIALFYNEYSHLRTNDLGTPFLEATPDPLHIVQPIVAAYEMDGESYGVEIAGEWFVSDSLTLKGHYRFFEPDLQPAGNTTAITPEISEGLSPQHQASLQSLYQVSENLTFDTWLRYVDSLPENGANNYVDLDIKLTWQFSPAVELSLTGQNLLEGARFEYQDKLITSEMPSQVERGVYAKAVVRF